MKADVLFAVSALSEGYLDNNEDRHAYTQLIEDYFAESGNETEAETDNEDGMRLSLKYSNNVSFLKSMNSVALLA